MVTKPYGDLTSPTKSPLDKDKLAMVSRGQTAQAAHSALFALQEESPEVMMAGAALLFATLIKRCGLDPQALHHMGLRLLVDQQGYRKDNASLQSLQDFAAIRILGEHNVSIS